MPSGLIAIEAENLIITQEVSSAPVYKVKYYRPCWPEGASGITVGIGYDCGYTTAAGIAQDWAGRIPDEMIRVLQSVAGLKGQAAGAHLHSAAVQGVNIPWDAALGEFEQVEIPRWVARVNKVFPGLEKLNPLCEGAMVSLCFNRGTALEGESRIEMKRIAEDLASGRPELVPAQFRSMKRLWNNGLVQRREVEAQLFEKGLAQKAA